jgi:hypothetical protein
MKTNLNNINKKSESHSSCHDNKDDSCLYESYFRSCNMIIMSDCEHDDSQKHLTFYLNEAYIPPKTIKKVDGQWSEINEGGGSC